MALRRRVAALCPALLVAAVASCAAPGAPGRTPAASPMPSPTETVMSSPSSAPSPSTPVPLPPGEVTAGTYLGPAVSPPVTLTVDDGWYATTLRGFFDVQQRRGTPEVIAVQVANLDGVVGQDGTSVTPGTAAEAARVVAANPGLEVLGESDARVGALSGRVVEVRNTSGTHTQILDVAPGRLGIDSGRALWIAFLDTPADGVLVVMVGGPADGWEDALAVAEPVLESIAVGE